MSDLVKRLVRLSEDGRGWEKARGLLAEAAAEIARLNELLRGTGANRYWEGRWRDAEAALRKIAAEQSFISAQVAADTFQRIAREALGK